MSEKSTFYDRLKYYSQKYYQGKPEISDEEFDLLVEEYENRFSQSYDYIRSDALLTRGNRVKLPVHMGSQNKFKTSKAIDEWDRKHSEIEKVITPKIDGTSCLITYDRKGEISIFTNSTESYAIQVNWLQPFLNLPKHDPKMFNGGGLIVRGELIISRSNFKKYLTENKSTLVTNYVNPLVWVTSILTSGEKKLDPRKAKYLEFIAYELMYPIKTNTSNRLDLLAQLGFKVVPYQIVKSVNEEILQQRLIHAIRQSPYPLDGIVIYLNNQYKLARSGNPDYSFAYKMHHFREVEVIDVVWNRNKGKITPTIHFTPFPWTSSQCYCQYKCDCDVEKPKIYKQTTGHSARAIIENKVGPGAIIQLRFNHPLWNWHQKVVRPSPNPSQPSGTWTMSGANAVQTGIESPQTAIKKIENFMKKLNIPYIREGVIKTLYQAGYQTIPDVLALTIQELETIEKIGTVSASNIVRYLSDGIDQASIVQLAAGSNCFQSLAGKKLELIDENLGILDLSTYSPVELSELLKSIPGIGPKLTEDFISGLPCFIELIGQIETATRKMIRAPPVKKQLAQSSKKTKPVDARLKSVVLSNIKGKDKIKNAIIELGGNVTDNITKTSTTLLIIGDPSNQTTKVKKAESYQIPIMTLAEFSDKYLR